MLWYAALFDVRCRFRLPFIQLLLAHIAEHLLLCTLEHLLRRLDALHECQRFPPAMLTTFIAESSITASTHHHI